MIRNLALGAVLALVLATAAGAATGWTPKQTAAILVSPSTSIYSISAPAGTVYASAPVKGWFSSAQCTGLGKASNGFYGAFSCAAKPTIASNPTKTFMVRPWSSSSACVTTVSLGSCPPPIPLKALANDPRRCVTNNGFGSCVLSAANKAMQQIAERNGTVYVAVHCQATASWMVYTCTWGNQTYGAGAALPKNETGTVRFVSSPSGWTASATIVT